MPSSRGPICIAAFKIVSCHTLRWWCGPQAGPNARHHNYSQILRVFPKNLLTIPAVLCDNRIIEQLPNRKNLWQYRIILSADTASEVRQLLSQKDVYKRQPPCSACPAPSTLATPPCWWDGAKDGRWREYGEIVRREELGVGGAARSGMKSLEISNE